MLVLDSPSFRTAILSLSQLNVSGSLLVEGVVTVSNETGWSLWPDPPITMGPGTSVLNVSSQTGKGLIDFTMMADKVLVPGPGKLGNVMYV